MYIRGVLCGCLVAAAVAAAPLNLRILDEHGKPTAARVRLRDAKGVLQPAGTLPPKALLAHPRFPDLGFVVHGECSFEAGPGLSVEVDRGTEYIPETLPAGAGPHRVVRLRRWVDMAKRGWWSADLHVHRDPADLPLLLEAADLNFAPVITKWNLNTNLEVWPEQPLIAAGSSRFYSVDNAEDERPWGAALFLGLGKPIGLYGVKTMWPLPTVTWKEARARSGFIDQEKIIWWAAPVMTALVRPDTIGVANNHFLEEGMLDSEAWGRPRDREKYPGFRGFTDYIFDLYYLYLSAGFRIPASAGSANGVLKNPLGYSRSYVHLDGSFSPAAWLEAQKAGRNFVTNGPALFFTANGQGPGSEIRPGTVSWKIEAVSRAALESVEIIVNGKVRHRAQSGPAQSQVNASGEMKVESGDWIAARCFEKNAHTVRFAHTSPVYVGSVAKRYPEALARVREWVDAYMGQVRSAPADLLNDEQKDQWLTLCRQARDYYR